MNVTYAHVGLLATIFKIYKKEKEDQMGFILGVIVGVILMCCLIVGDDRDE